MNFWLNYMYENNGLSADSPTAAAAISYSDASATGCASIITPCPNQESIVTHREFTEHEQTLSSTYRELVAIFHGLESAKHQLAGHALKWHTVSKNMVSIVREGSMVQPLLELALSIFHITRQFNITLSMNWISRDYNENADRFSRIIDHDDWGVSPSAFSYICDIMGSSPSTGLPIHAIPRRLDSIAVSFVQTVKLLTPSRRTGMPTGTGSFLPFISYNEL